MIQRREAPARLQRETGARVRVRTPLKPALRHHVRKTIPRLSRFAVEHLLLLPLGALIALVWVNTAPESYYSFTYAISFAVNDVAMMIFLCVDGQGDRRSDGSGWRAAHVAARHAARDCVTRRECHSGTDLSSRRRGRWTNPSYPSVGQSP